MDAYVASEPQSPGYMKKSMLGWLSDLYNNSTFGWTRPWRWIICKFSLCISILILTVMTERWRWLPTRKPKSVIKSHRVCITFIISTTHWLTLLAGPCREPREFAQKVRPNTWSTAIPNTWGKASLSFVYPYWAHTPPGTSAQLPFQLPFETVDGTCEKNTRIWGYSFQRRHRNAAKHQKITRESTDIYSNRLRWN